MFKDDPKLKDAFRYAKAKGELVLHKASELIERPLSRDAIKTAKVVATAHLFAIMLAAFHANFPVTAQHLFDLSMWVVAPLSAPNPPAAGGTGIDTFTPLHQYFISPSGSNANNCLTQGTACLDPSAAGLSSVVCGDVVIAAAGTYNGDFATWQTVSSCGSSTGGVNNAGEFFLPSCSAAAAI